MRIAFDHQIFSHQRYGGISRYFARLAEELNALGHETRVFAPLHFNYHLAHLPATVCSGRFIQNPQRGLRRVAAFGGRHVGGMQLSRWKPDVIHETYFDKRAFGVGRIPAVLTVYDMIHELFPDQFALGDPTSRLKREAVRRADHIICISHNTARDLCRLFTVPEEMVSVVHLGVDLVRENDATTNLKADVSHDPFLLYVGARGGYKNFSGLLHAFSRTPSLKQDFVIVAFGGGPLSTTEVSLIRRLGLAGRVICASGADSSLNALYATARALIYPSQYEGFGLPPLEAMAHGCPVVCTRASSLPEVVGCAAELFDPSDFDSMSASIERVAYSDQYRSELIKRGSERVRKFSWQNCAEETSNVYRRVIA
jgi:glycosyltransferase involved in cell wall biosynthesis